MSVDFASLNNFDVRQVFDLHFALNDAQHRGLDVAGVDLAGRSHEPRKPCGHVSGPGAHICDDHARANADEPESLIWCLLPISPRTVEPAWVSGDAGNLTAGERMDRRPRSDRDKTGARIERGKAKDERENVEAKSPGLGTCHSVRCWREAPEPAHLRGNRPSSARLSSNTFTCGSPSTPRVRPSVCSATTA